MTAPDAQDRGSPDGPGIVPRSAAPGAHPVSALAAALEGPKPIIAVELRPPAADVDPEQSVEEWIDLHQLLRTLTGQGRFVFLTDNAVGKAEEENLAHILSNLPEDAPRENVVPILTAKHTLDYCLLYAQRAAAAGLDTLTVVGGDRDVGPPRCVDHAWELREHIRERVPSLALGGWANPHRPAAEQAGFLTDARACADFFLTQIVTHHNAEGLAELTAELERRGSRLKALAGVFLFRSANPRTLDRLNRYFPVPVEELTREFESGRSAVEICARSIRAALDAGAAGVYLSNLGLRSAARRLRAVLARLDELEPANPAA